MKKPILWAVDFSTHEFKKQKSLLKLGLQFAKAWDCQIQPVFVLNNKLLRMNVDLFFRMQGVSEVSLEKAVFLNFISEDDKKSEYLAENKLLLSNSYTQRGLVQSFLEYAKDVDARAILCSTRTRSKYYPSFLGGFTEALLNKGNLPILSCHSDLDTDREIKKVMYATDLSQEENEEFFLEVISFAKKHSASIDVFFNYQPLDQTYYIAPQFPSNDVYEKILEGEKKEKASYDKRGRALAEKASNEEVECHFINVSDSCSVDESILNHIKNNKVDLVAMSSKAGSIEGAIIGSSGKEVLRQSPCPVWIVHK